MPIELANGTYRVQIRKNGFPRVDKVFNSLKAAEKFEELEREKMATGLAALRPQMTFSEAIALYHKSSAFRQKKENTRKTELSRIKRALEALGEYSLENLANGQRVILFFDTLHDEKLRIVEKKKDGTLAPKKNAVRRDGDPDGTLRNESIRLEIAAVSAVMNWAVTMKILPYNPIKRITRPSDLARRRRLMRDEELAVLTTAASAQHGADQRGQDARFIGLLRELGCRPFELASLLREDVDIENRAVRFRDTKNGTDRTVHAVKGAVDLLSIQVLQSEIEDGVSPFVFTSYSRATLQPVAFRYRSAVDRLRRAGIVGIDFFASACRREYVSAAFEHGLSHEDIRKQSGHKSIKALEIYNVSNALHPDARARVDAEARRRAQERLEDIAAVFGVSMEDFKDLVAKKAQETEVAAQQRAKSARDSLLGLIEETMEEVKAGKPSPKQKTGTKVQPGARTAMRGKATPSGRSEKVVPKSRGKGKS
jgi:integrase